MVRLPDLDLDRGGLNDHRETSCMMARIVNAIGLMVSMPSI